MSKLDLLLEAERRGILPPDKAPLLAEARSRGLVPAQVEEPSTALRALTQFSNTVPGATRIKAMAQTVGENFGRGEFVKDPGAFWDQYDRNFQAQEKQKADLDRTYGATDIAAKTAGLTTQALMTLPAAGYEGAKAGGRLAADTFYEMMTPRLAANPTLAQTAKETARIGAGTAAPIAYLDSPNSDPIARTQDVATGAIGGGLLGLGLPYALAAPGAVRRAGSRAIEALTGTPPARRALAAQRAQEMQDAGVPVFGPALSEEPRFTGLVDSVGGQPLRRAAGRSIQALDDRVQAELSGAGMPGSRYDAGQGVQQTVRRNLLERNLPAEQIARMTPEELAAISTIQPGQTRPTPRPYVEPVPPRPIDEIPPRPVQDVPPREAQPGSYEVNFKPQPFEQFQHEGPAQWRADRRQQRVQDFEAAKSADVSAFDQMKRNLGNEVSQAGFISAQVIDSGPMQGHVVFTRKDGRKLMLNEVANSNPDLAAKVGKWYREDVPRINQRIAEHNQVIGLAQKRAEELAAKAQAEKQRAWREQTVQQSRQIEQEAEQQAMASARARAQEEAAAETSRLRMEAQAEADRLNSGARAQAQDEAARITRQREATAQGEYARAYRDNQPEFVTGRNPGYTYKDEFGALYEQAGRQIPRTARVPFAVTGDQSPHGANAVYRVLDDLRTELRSRGLLRGDMRALNIFKTAVRGGFEQALRSRLPREVVGAIYARVPIHPQDIKRIRGQLREAGDVPAHMRTWDDALLQRLESAASEDMHAFLARGGQEMQQAGQMIRGTDAAYRAYKEDLVRPLRQVFGDNVSAEQAFGRLVKAAQGGDLQMLRAAYRVYADKADVRQLTAAIIGHGSEQGIAGVVQTLRSLTPEARRLMFAGNAQPLGEALGRLSRVADRLEPFRDAAAAGNIGVNMRIPNMTAGMSSLAYGIEGALISLGGQAALSRFLSSPAYVNWLTRAVQVRTPAQERWRPLLGMLASVAMRDADRATGQLAIDAIKEMVAPKKARAESAQNGGEFFTSLEKPPTPDEVREAVAKGQTTFDIDLEQDGAAQAVQAIKSAGGKITAYHVGGGGGRQWGSAKNGEQVRKYTSPEELAALTEDTKALVAKGADTIHFDNTHRMSGKTLERVADAIKAGGAGFMAKNNADKWNLVMRRRPDLKPDYAVIEAAMHDADETQAAYDLHARGVPVYIIGFKQPIDKNVPAVTDEYAREYQRSNPWARVLLMQNEQAYEGRTGQFLSREK